MNKTLIAVGVSIWGIMLALSFILRISLDGLMLTTDQILNTLFPLTLIEIIGFVIALIGLIKD